MYNAAIFTYLENSMIDHLRSYARRVIPFMMIVLIAAPAIAMASGGEGAHNFSITFLWMAVILIAAKLSSLVEKIGQPAVLGELIIGVIMGNLVLLNINIFEPILHDTMITFLAELGVVILLFQIGLESNINEMRKVGPSALMVAIIGVVLPFILGTYVVGPWLLPEMTQHAHLFLGAALTATSVGITARVFKDLGALQTKEAQIVLGAAVIDDVLGLIILAIVSAIVTVGSVTVGAISLIAAKAIIFLIGSIVVGQLFAPSLGKAFSKVHAGVGMKFTLAISFGLIFAWAAKQIGLEPIVGAFAAGLILDPVHFKYFKDAKVVSDMKKATKEVSDEVKEKIDKALGHHKHSHIEDLIEPIAFFLVPIFFVVTGMQVSLETLFNPSIILVALIVTVVAIIGKYAAGLAAGNVNKKIVGFGMVPRGEVGLIFASIGAGLGVINDELFSIIVIMVIITTLAAPPILSHLIKKQAKGDVTA
jgi:Kef-type K+ transport system membrane component KefB